MKKILAFVLLIIFAVCSAFLITLLNLRISIFSPEKIKSLADRSNAYEFVAAQLRENLLNSQSESIGDGPLLEIINEAVPASFIKRLAEEQIDAVFASILDPSKSMDLNVPIHKFQDQINQAINTKLNIKNSDQDAGDISFVTETSFILNTSDSLPIRYAGKLNQLMASLTIIVILSFIFIFFLSSPVMSAKFVWVGWSFLITGLLLAATTYLICFLPLQYQDQLASYLHLGDPKLAIGLKKIVNLAVTGERIYFLPETIGTIILGAIMIFFGRSIKEENVEIIKP